MPTEDNVEVVRDAPVADENPNPVERETPDETEEVEEPVEEETQDETEGESELDLLKKENETLKAQKEHWRSKAEKAAKPKASSKETDDFRPRVEFLLTNRDIDDAAYRHIATVAMRDSGEVTVESLEAAKQTEKDYLSLLKQRSANSRKSPSSTGSSASSRLVKSFKEISEMTPEEHQAYEQQLTEAESRGI